MIKVEDRRIVRAPIQKVFQLVSRLDSQPHVTGLWLSADLLDRRANAMTVHYKGFFGGIPVESVQRATLHPPQRIEFRQSRGGLKAFQGRYSLKPIEGDTELTLEVEADVGIALITDDSAQRVLHAYVERSLQKLKFLAERDLPRAVRRQGEQAVPAAPAVETPPQPLPPSAPVPQPAPQAPQATQPGQPGSGRKRRRRRRRRPGRGPAPPSPPSRTGH